MHRRPHLSATRRVAVWPRTHVAAASVAAGVAFAVLTLVTACSHDVKVRLPSGVTSSACADVARHLPAQLLGGDRRDTDPSSAALAAWGDPAIIWRCGVAAPGPTADLCIAVDGIDWVARPLPDGYDFTTYGRTPAVQVLVPKKYAPETFALTGLSKAVATIAQGETPLQLKATR